MILLHCLLLTNYRSHLRFRAINVQKRQVLLLDTMIIIESIRAKCWNALAGTYQVETVEKVNDEALAGDPLRPGYVEVSSKALRSGIHKIHAVSDVERINFAQDYENADALDAGERDLFAHMYGRTDDWITSCADRGALRVALIMGWKDKIVSLENLIKNTGENPNPQLLHHYSEAWLSQVRTEYLLNNM